MNIPIEMADYFENGRRKLINVVPLDDFSLKLEFDNGDLRNYCIKDKLTGILSVLLDADKFRCVFIDENGNIAWDIDDGISSSVNWGNRIDLCADAAYVYSTPIVVAGK